MAMKSPHRDWKLDEITPILVRAVGLDQLLTNLWLNVLHGGRPLVRMGIPFEGVEQVAALMERRREDGFVGFSDVPGAAETWLRADLLRVMKRRPAEFAVARPVHALAARIRGPVRVSNDSDASLVVYDWLQAVDPTLIEELRALITVEVDDGQLDLASFALALLGDEQEADVPRPGAEAATRQPLCLGQAATYCDDLRRLLAYRAAMPRTVLVDHVKRLTAFHLGVYLLRLFRIVTDVEQQGGAGRLCDACREGRIPTEPCPYRLEMLVDCGEDARSPIAKLAEQSWATQEDVLGRYIRSHLVLKKLHEFGENLKTRYSNEAVPFETVDQIAAIEESVKRERLDYYFDSRIDELASSGGDVGERVRELEVEYRQLGLSSFRTYVALLAYFSERRWLNYHRQLLDSLFNKNSAEGAMRQPLGGRRLRRMALGASLLETLTLIAVVEKRGGTYATRPLRVDRLIIYLDDRYDVLVSRPPERQASDPQVLAVLAGNVDRLKARLRETGLYTDLSDAFLAQTIKPRIVIDGSEST